MTIIPSKINIRQLSPEEQKYVAMVEDRAGRCYAQLAGLDGPDRMAVLQHALHEVIKKDFQSGFRQKAWHLFWTQMERRLGRG